MADTSEQKPKILIVLLGAIGDVTRALALAVRIKKDWADCRLCWAVEPRSKGILEGHPAIDELIIFDRPGGFAAFIDFVRRIRQSRFDIVLDLQRHFKSGVTSFFSGARRRIGFHPRNAKEFNWLFNSEYIAAVPNLSSKLGHYQKFGDKLEIRPLVPLDFGLQPSAAEIERAQALIKAASDFEPVPPERRAIFLLGSTWPSRFWPTSFYIETVDALWELYQLRSILIGSSTAEISSAQEICENCKEAKPANLSGKTSLRELIAIFAQCRVVIGPDCGPMHIAAAVGAPVVSLWGATSPKRSAPYGSEELVLQSPIGCSPCYRRICPGLDVLCMKDLPPEAVVARVQQVLSRRRAA